ncbi:MAG: DGQHR domain-containing protein [Ekhidna sp.]|nr:DGQHR domain-containing protein [Ekhidna sp.]
MAINKPILLPAIQGDFGNWVYYSAIMSLSEVNKRISFARELHKNNRLGELIQRQLQDSGTGRFNRANKIAQYLITNEERFFNSIVVGIYGGQPKWHPFKIQPHSDFETAKLEFIADEDRVGFLELQGTEQMFALDGQHRVAGIKKALSSDEVEKNDYLTVLFVPHQNSPEGLQRTRRLFVDLNKHSIPVGKKDIIILDEVDLAAILARRLVDEHDWFSRGQVDIERFTDAIPKNSSSLFSIATLYNIINILFPYVLATNKEERDELKEAKTIRLSEERIDHYYKRVSIYFEGLSEIDSQLKNYLEMGPNSGIAESERTPEVCNILFRPVGQIVFAETIADLAIRRGLEFALISAQYFPTDMKQTPFVHVIWDPDQNKIISKNRSLATNLLKYMCGNVSEKDKLLQRYRLVLGNENIGLPKQLTLK